MAHQQSCAEEAESRSQGMLFPWKLPFILACQVGHPELSRAELLPPLYGTHFSFEMSSSTHIHARTRVGTHMCLHFFPLPLPRKEKVFPVAHFRHGSTFSAPDSISNLGKEY